MNFETAQARARAYILDLPEATTELVPEWVNQAVREAEEQHNFRHMEETIPSVITVAGERLLVAKPEDWKETRGDPFIVRFDGGIKEIDWLASESDANRMYSNSPTLSIGPPEMILETESELEVYPLPDENSDWADGDYRVSVPYWKYSPEMVEPEDTTPILTLAKYYVIYQATAYGLIFNRDEERAATYFQLATNYLMRLKNRDKRSRLPGRMTLTPRKGVYGPGLRPRRSFGEYRHG